MNPPTDWNLIAKTEGFPTPKAFLKWCKRHGITDYCISEYLILSEVSVQCKRKSFGLPTLRNRANPLALASLLDRDTSDLTLYDIAKELGVTVKSARTFVTANNKPFKRLPHGGRRNRRHV